MRSLDAVDGGGCSAQRDEATLKRSDADAPVFRACSQCLLGTRDDLVYDLHDGPLQSIAPLTCEAALFRQQLAQTLDGHSTRDVLLGRAEDVIARIAARADELREIAIGASGVADVAVSTALAREVQRFTSETRIAATLKMTRNLDHLTPRNVSPPFVSCSLRWRTSGSTARQTT